MPTNQIRRGAVGMLPAHAANAHAHSKKQIVTGFEPAEIDALIGDLIDPEEDPADIRPDIGKRLISRKGDLWLLGHASPADSYQRSVHET